MIKLNQKKSEERTCILWQDPEAVAEAAALAAEVTVAEDFPAAVALEEAHSVEVITAEASVAHPHIITDTITIITTVITAPSSAEESITVAAAVVCYQLFL